MIFHARLMSDLRVLAGILAAATLLGLTPGPVLAADCRLERQASVDVELNAAGGVLVPVQINGHDAWMALNMATGMPVIVPAALDRLGLKSRPAITVNAFWNGKKVRQLTDVRSLRIGGTEFTDWPVFVEPGESRPALEYKGRPVIGVLSTMFMNVVDVELDLAGRKLNLFRQTSCGDKAVYWDGQITTVKLYRDLGGLMFFPMEIEGKLVDTSLNTVDRRSWLNERVARDYFGFRITSPGVVRETIPGGGRPFQIGVRPMNLSARDLTLTDVPIALQGFKSPGCVPTRSSSNSGAIGFGGCNSIVPLELGTDLLGKLRIYIATKENRVYFTRAETAAPALPVQQAAP